MFLLLLVFGGSMLISLYASAKVKSTYRKYSAVPASSGATGAEVAAQILQRSQIYDVQIHCQEGMLSDHYDPIHKRLVLSHDNYYGYSCAALGVAAHECGHALQHAQQYAPLNWRMAAVGVTTYANQVVTFLPLIGLFTGLISYQTTGLIMALAWGVIMLFNLVTLPVEFDASNRAKRILAEMGHIGTVEEVTAVKKVLDAAALTYVAAFITSLGYMIYHLLPLLTGGRRSDD